MILLHMKNCHHCAALMPTWDAASENWLNFDEDSKLGHFLCKLFGVHRFPTVLRGEVFRGKREVDQLREFAGNGPLLLLHMKKCHFCEELLPVWNKAHRDRHQWSAFDESSKHGQELCKLFQVASFPTIIRPAIFDGERTEESLRRFSSK